MIDVICEGAAAASQVYTRQSVSKRVNTRGYPSGDIRVDPSVDPSLFAISLGENPKLKIRFCYQIVVQNMFPASFGESPKLKSILVTRFSSKLVFAMYFDPIQSIINCSSRREPRRGSDTAL